MKTGEVSIYHYNSERLGLALAGFAILALSGILIAVNSTTAVLLYALALFAIGVYQYRYLLPSFLICLSLFSGRGVLLGGFGYWEVIAILIAAALVLNIPFNKDSYFPLYGKCTFVCILGWCSILVGHYIANKLGVGTGSEGGLRIAIVAVLVTFSCLLIHSDQLRLVKPQLIPYIGLVPGIFALAIELINNFIPSAVPYTLLVYDRINWEVRRAYECSSQFDVTRLSGLREIGFYLALLGATYLLKTKRMATVKGMVIFCVSFFLVLAAGYRSYFISFFIILLIVSWLKARRFFLINAGLLAAILVILSVVNIYVTELPLPVQRTLCWFPGKWHAETEMSAKDGWMWRKTMWNVYLHTEFRRYIWFGQGQRFFSDEQRSSTPMDFSSIRYFIRSQSLHSGLLTILDFIGIAGFLFFVFATLRSYYNCLILFRTKDELRPWMVWIILFYLSRQPAFWITGFFYTQFIQISICMSMLEWMRYSLSVHNYDYQQTIASEIEYKELGENSR